MDLVTPGIGLVFWTTIIFLTLLIVLGKVAWKPINNAIKKRSQSIEDALNQAEIAREEMKKLQADNEKIMDEARAERDKMLKEAREIKDTMNFETFTYPDNFRLTLPLANAFVSVIGSFTMSLNETS